MSSSRRLIHNIRHGWLSVLLFYSVLLSVAFALHYYAQKLPGAAQVALPSLVAPRAEVLEGLRRVWFIFVWGFGLQLLIQIWRIVRRRPKDANLPQLLKHGAWISLNAGVFEELIFRYYGFAATVIGLQFANDWAHDAIKQTLTHTLLPVANVLSLGLLSSQLSAANWALGGAMLLGSVFFRDAHRHYGKLAKANVWFIGLVMFWLMFNYGLVAAIIAHVLYDFVIYACLALTSILQPALKPQAE